MIEIDGSCLEGGGQIIRTAVALSAVTKMGVHIFNIRKGREKPGLRPQHLEGIVAAAKMCNAEVEGLQLNSLDVVFIPKTITGGKYLVDTKTAGSVTLILQMLVPISIHSAAPVNLRIKGGTAVPFSPTIEYFQHILCGILAKMGISIFVETKRQGFYPVGGGEIFVKVEPGDLKNIQWLERGAQQNMDTLSVASRHLKAARVAERMIDGFKKVLPDGKTRLHYVDAQSPGCFIRSHVHFDYGKIGAEALGKIGKKAEAVGDDAARNLKSEIESGAPIDSWMVDQIIPYMGLATCRTHGESKVKIPKLTKHAETSIWVVKKFLPVEYSIKNNVMTCCMISK
jgi:RNA 3'-phosphate cyclase